MCPPGAGLPGQWGRRPSVEGSSSGGPSPFVVDCLCVCVCVCACTRTHTHVYWGRSVLVYSPGAVSVPLLRFHFPPLPGTLAETEKSGSRVLFLLWVRVFMEVFASPGQVSQVLLSLEAPGQCSCWQGPAVQMCRVPWSWCSQWMGRGLLTGPSLGLE